MLHIQACFLLLFLFFSFFLFHSRVFNLQPLLFECHACACLSMYQAHYNTIITQTQTPDAIVDWTIVLVNNLLWVAKPIDQTHRSVCVYVYKWGLSLGLGRTRAECMAGSHTDKRSQCSWKWVCGCKTTRLFFRRNPIICLPNKQPKQHVIVL